MILKDTLRHFWVKTRGGKIGLKRGINLGRNNREMIIFLKKYQENAVKKQGWMLNDKAKMKKEISAKMIQFRHG